MKQETYLAWIFHLNSGVLFFIKRNFTGFKTKKKVHTDHFTLYLDSGIIFD